jgi:hypothetical protein
MPEKRDLLDTVFCTGKLRLVYPRKKTGVAAPFITGYFFYILRYLNRLFHVTR